MAPKKTDVGQDLKQKNESQNKLHPKEDSHNLGDSNNRLKGEDGKTNTINKDVPSDDGLKELECAESKLSTRWMLIFVLDLIINNWGACQEILIGTQTNFIPITFDLPLEFKFTSIQFRWTSCLRLIFISSLIYLRNHFRGAKKDLYIKYICSVAVLVTSVLLLHIVYRILLDSEEVEVLEHISYWFLISWNVIVTTGLGVVTYSELTSNKNKDSGETTPADVGSSRKERKYGHPGPSDKATFFKLLALYRPFLGHVFIAYIFLIIQSTAHSLKPYYKAKVIDVIKSEDPSKDLTDLVIRLALIALVGSVTSAIWSGVSSIVRYRLTLGVQSRLFQWMVQQDMGFFDNIKTGELTDCLSSDAESFGGVLSRMDNIIKAAVQCIVMTISMGRLSWQLTLVVVVGNMYLVVGTHFYGNYTKNLYKKTRQSRRQASAIADEALSSIRTVRSFGSENEEIERYDEKIQERYDLQMKQAWLHPIYDAFDQMFVLLLSCATIYYGGHLVVREKITSGDLVSFILYQTQLVGAMSRLLMFRNWLMASLGSSEKAFQYLDADKIAPADGTEEPQSMSGKLEFKDVTFAYPTRPAANVFENLSFCVEPGEVVAVVGPSGAGKSSCFSLIERFYKPSSGQILLDSTPLDDYKHTYLRSKLTLVSQEPTLFGRTIRENIRYGLKDEQVCESDIKEAAVNANAATFIDNFPDGYETYVGERGIQLSGGQKQRVAIARALVRNPAVLLLDEATSALDTESERQVQDALDRTMPGRTVMIIAHRLSTVKKADRILVLNRGAIVEQGSHEELLKKEGLYHRLIHRQLITMTDSKKNTT